jgi:hypothetical protein
LLIASSIKKTNPSIRGKVAVFCNNRCTILVAVEVVHPSLLNAIGMGQRDQPSEFAGSFSSRRTIDEAESKAPFGQLLFQVVYGGLEAAEDQGLTGGISIMHGCQLLCRKTVDDGTCSSQQQTTQQSHNIPTARGVTTQSWFQLKRWFSKAITKAKGSC